MIALDRFLLAVATASVVAESQLTVKTNLGTVNGIQCTTSTSKAFLSIPFAQPPVGSLRFEPPVAYNGTFPAGGLDATKLSPPCIQFGTEFIEPQPCLFLNVWAPPNSTPNSNLPVKFWVYGGTDNAGGIADPLYNGCNIATDAVVVSATYRLGVLGFIALDSANISGNMGVQDIALALQWVQDNIAAFGGDPKKVLLFGQSSGAGLSWVLSSLSQAPQLMAAVITESAGGYRLPTNVGMQNIGAKFAAAINCSVTDTACFKSKSTTELNATLLHGAGISLLETTKFQPYVDGKIIPAQPLDVGSKVPQIAGSNSMEGTLLIVGDYDPLNVSSSDYTTFLQNNFGNYSTTIENLYPLSLFKSSPLPAFDAIAYIYTLVSYLCPTRQALLATIKAGIPAWTYYNQHQPTCGWYSGINSQEALDVLGPTHTSEIPFVFLQLTHLPPPNGTCNFNAQEIAISRVLVSAWTSMASQQNPSGANTLIGGTWPQFSLNASMGLLITNSTGVEYVNYTQCDFWDEVDGVVSSSLANGTTTGSASASSTSASSSPTQTASAVALESSILLIFVAFLASFLAI